LTGHHRDVRSVAFTPDGAYVISWAMGESIRKWDVMTGYSATPIAGVDNASTVAVSSDGASVVSYSEEPGSVTCLALSPDGSQVFAALGDGTILVWGTLPANKECRVLTGHTSEVYSVAFVPAHCLLPDFDKSSSASCLVSGSTDQSVRIWTLADGQQLEESLLSPASVWCVSAACPTQGDDSDVQRVFLAAGTQEGQVLLWDAESRQLLWTVVASSARPIECLAFSPFGMHIASASWDGTVRFWSVETGEQAGEPLVLGQSIWARCVAFSPNGTQIVVGDDVATVRIWD
ncbi:WD40 repeat-like protein, partial [Exidia glandulosa HHB12029]